MAEKNFNNVRIVNKHDTEANWLKATGFTPKQGELIVYDIDDNYSYERIKIGDGVQNVNDLPFVDANKVDKVSGKGLSTNDYTTTEKNKLAGIAEGANKTVVDSALSTTSSNPVQNKVVNTAISTLNTLIGDTSVSEQISKALLEHTTSHAPSDAEANVQSNWNEDSNTSDAYILNKPPIKAGGGTASIIVGDISSNTAEGDYAYAGGRESVASGNSAHAEGYKATASEAFSYAQGRMTKATGYASHAEGTETVAKGYASHAEGMGTIAGSSYQHVQGLYNIEDTKGTYIHIVGNGGGSSLRSNAHTLDKDGNAWFAGEVKVGGVGQDDEASKTLATTEYVDSKVSNVNIAIDSELSSTSENPVQNKVINAVISELGTLVGDKSVSEQITKAIVTKADISTLPNNNLLDNWYFANPVNSQGLTSYYSGTYAIDRWFMRTAKGNIVNGGFQVYNADGISFYGITQALNNPTQYCGKTLTLSAKITEINTASAIELKIASSTQVSGVGTVINEIKNIRTPGIYSVTATIPDTLPSTTLAVWITCRDATVGANYTIESVKLEFGSVSTLAADPIPNKADQLARCSSYDASGTFLNALFATQAFVLKYVPKITKITLRADYWVFNANAYYQDVALNCVTTTSKVDLQPTYYQLAEWQTDGLAFSTESKKGTVRVWVTDVEPKEDITIQVTVQEVLEV